MPKPTQISLFDLEAPAPVPDPEIVFAAADAVEPEALSEPTVVKELETGYAQDASEPIVAAPVAEVNPPKNKLEIPERAPLPPKVILVEVPDAVPVTESIEEEAGMEAFAEDEPVVFEEQEAVAEPIFTPQPSILPAKPARLRLSRDQSVKKSTRGRKPLNPEGPVEPIEVPDDETLFQKMYYPIGQVAEMFKVNPSLIRLWENEFDILKPRKNGKGDRLFRPEDVKNLKLIHHLIREKKYTMEGAKAFLKRNKQAEERFALIESLKKLQGFLRELKAGM